jgi:hypothetical protein
MRYLTERLMQTVFLLVGFPLSGLLSTRRSPEMNSMKCDWIPRLRARPLAACAHNTNWDVELRSGAGTPGNPRWVNNTIPRPPRSLGRARSLLKEAGSPKMVTLVGPPAMPTGEAAAAAAAGEPRRPI